jgi:uncharacterized protein YneF (UPF0154 family)
MGKRVDVFRFVGIGWYIALCILLGTLGGRWLGQKLNSNSSEVIFTLLGLGVGVIVAFFGVYRLLKPIMSNNQDKDKGNN